VLLYGVLLLFQVPGRMGDCSPLGDLTEQLSRTLLEDALQGGWYLPLPTRVLNALTQDLVTLPHGVVVDF
jgi:hypothetical protein